MSVIRQIQDTLSKYQTSKCSFIFGPLVVSPIKAVISLIQIIAGAVFLGYRALGDIFNGREFSEETKAAFIIIDDGFSELNYSILNMVTLGIAGTIIEGIRWSAKQIVEWIPRFKRMNDPLQDDYHFQDDYY